MKGAILQYDPAYLDVERNLAAVDGLIDSLDADLLVLPELFAAGYFFKSSEDLRSVAETADGRTVEQLKAWSRDKNAVIVAGFPELTASGIYNSAAVVSPQGLVGVYRKVHLFYREKELFQPGDLGFPVFDVKDQNGEPYRLGVMICFDWYFPESARSLALSGADVIAHPSNLVRKDCPRSMPIRALENHVFTVTANRVGGEESDGELLTFIGQSLACDPAGEVLCSFTREGVGVETFSFDPKTSRNRDITATNNLFGDRRAEVYRLA